MKIKSCISAIETIADKEISLILDPINGTIITSYNYQEIEVVDLIPISQSASIQVIKNKDGIKTNKIQKVESTADLINLEQSMISWMTEFGDLIINNIKKVEKLER